MLALIGGESETESAREREMWASFTHKEDSGAVLRLGNDGDREVIEA
jgi:hypothetical protein